MALKSGDSLHLIAFDIPYPANYGGVIDIYFKAKALHDAGIKVILHCFEYGRPEAKELELVCKNVFYYKRKTFKNIIYGNVPYIVASRTSDELLGNLLSDNYPILFEGLHTTSYLKHPELKDRFKIVRTHNVEHEYYRHLELLEKNIFKRYFFKLEAEKLKKYQSVLKYANLICAISPKDTAYFQKKFGKTIFIPAFHPNNKINAKPGKGEFVLYHGNLAVGENHEAAMYLVKNVFSDLKLPFVIAGSHPKKELRQLIEPYPHIKLIDDGNSEHIIDLIRNARINLLYTDQDTGIKLKLLNALFNGRHCIVNHKMVDNTGLEGLCSIAENAQSFKKLIKEHWDHPFDSESLEIREAYFKVNFNNCISVETLINAIPSQEKQVSDSSRKLQKPIKQKLSITSLFGLLPF